MPDTSASLYEQLFPLTTVMKQRFVDNFSGDSLNERWAEHGSGTLVMDDAVNGGLKISSATSGVTRADFAVTDGTKSRQYSGSGSVFLAVAQLTEVQFGIMTMGLEDKFWTEAGDTCHCVVYGDMNGLSASEEKIKLVSTEFANIDAVTDVGQLYLEHSFKIEMKSSSAELTIDGILEATGGASIAANCQPLIEASPSEGTAVSVANYRYVECYNT